MFNQKCQKCQKTRLTGKYKTLGTCFNCSNTRLPPPPPLPPQQDRSSFNSIELSPRSDISNNYIKTGERDSQRHFTPKQREQIFLKDNHMCKECRSNKNLEADHIIPWAKGGKTIVENGQTLCSTCNKAKSDN